MHTTQEGAHRSKRHLTQPAITDFFPIDESFDSDAPSHNDITTPDRPTLAPHVPGAVQADLMQVGMRVRKSVPEGYKTHANKMMALPSISTTMTSTMTLTPPPTNPANVVHQRELLPFCGLHKIGGFADQPTTNIHLYTGEADVDARDMWPLPAETFTQPFHSCSQDSGYGSIRANANPSKRSWHDEDELRLDLSTSSFAFGKQAQIEIEEVPVSPLSEIPEDMMPAVRQIKQPKSRRREGEGGNEPLRVAVGSGSDFDEADFLGSGEVVMGGV
ncbi:hypothetical protein HBH68_198220 [Parastagonospora nodorum]|nr:hypothetical protein HBH68_198220 [Parastagonospora nodorum]